MKECFENVVGMRNVCGGDAAKYYLDDIGISLKAAAKTVDSKYITGSELVKAKIAQAWRDTLNDVELSGFYFKKVLCTKTVRGCAASTPQTLTNGTGVITLKRYNWHDHTVTYISSVKVEAVGLWTLTIGSLTFSGNGSSVVNVMKSFSEMEVDVTIQYTQVDSYPIISDLTCDCLDDCRLSVYGAGNYGLTFDVSVVCDSEQWLCRYAEFLGEAVMYKAGALLLKELMDTDRVNDFTIMKEGNLLVNLAYLDSSLNMYQFEDNRMKVPDGKYQQVMARLNKKIAAPKKTPCVECAGGRYVISLP